jgi:nucleotide-binding universal stress UspA family protein
MQSRLDEALAGLDATGSVVEGHAADCLSDAAADADLLLVGARGYGPHDHVFVGSVSSRLMRKAPCPVLVLPRPARA